MNHFVQYTQPRIAVVEDEDDLRDDLVEFLMLRPFQAQGFASAESLFRAWSARAFDLVILDIGLPGMDGLQALQWLRARSTAGIVMLTAMDSQATQVTGLESGADAYLVKTASLDVIEATCRSVLRRLPQQAEATETVQADWLLNLKSWRLTVPGGEHIELTHSESIFLGCVMRAPGVPTSRDTLLEAFGKPCTLSNMRNLDNCVSRLRRKLQVQLGLEIPIRSSYGSGYTFTGECGVKD